MGVSKVIYGDDTLIDISEDTVAANNLLSGVTAHDSSGTQITGNVIIPTDFVPASTGGTFEGDVTIDKTDGTTSTIGQSKLILGNSTGSGTDENSKGVVRLYSRGSKYVDICAPDGSAISDNYELNIPNKSGTIALTSDLKNGTVTSVATGTGLQGGTITSSGTIQTYLPRVKKSCNALPGANKIIWEEYQNGTSYNLPSNAWYHIISLQGEDTNYGTQLALGMTTSGAYYRNYNAGSWGNWRSIINTDSGGTVTSVKVGTTSYSPSSGVVSLPAYPTVNNATLTIQKNGTTVKTFTANASSNVTCNITVPTNTNELTNGAGYITSSGSCASASTAVSCKDAGLIYCYLSNGTAILQGNSGKAVWLQIKDLNWKVVFQADGNLVVYQGNTAKWNSGTSSRRFKHNIQDMTEERARKILDIRPVTFDWNDDQPITTGQYDNAGVIAEEVSQVCPDLVVFEDLEDGSQVERRVEYERFTPYLIKMVQMQQREIDILKEEVRLLKERL